MNEALIVVGMMGAFLLGAFIRQPFKIAKMDKKHIEQPEPSRRIVTDAILKEKGLTLEEEMTNLMNWTGKDRRKKLFVEQDEPNED